MTKTLIGNRIKAFRKNIGLTQFELAKKLGISRPTVCSWEINRTEPSINDIERLSSIFGITKSELLGDYQKDIKISKIMQRSEVREFVFLLAENVPEDKINSCLKVLTATLNAMI